MKYKTSAYGVDSAECRAMRRSHPDMEHQTHVPATMLLRTDRAYVDFSGPSGMYRPYLMLQGATVGYEGDFPGNISRISLDRESDQKRVNYIYELSDENLADMVKKGLYDRDFEIPNIISHNTWELPCTCELYSMPCMYGSGPDAKPGTLLFIRAEDGSAPEEESSLVCADRNCTINGRDISGSGYTVNHYFRDKAERQLEEAELGELKDLEDVYEAASDMTEYDQMELYDEDDLSAYVSQDDQAFLEGTSLRTEGDSMTEEERARYEDIRKRAEAAWAQRKDDDEQVQAAMAAAVAAEADVEPEETAEPDDRAAKSRSVQINKAENVDSAAELLEEGDSLTARTASLVEASVKDELKQEVRRKSLPEPDAEHAAAELDDLFEEDDDELTL